MFSAFACLFFCFVSRFYSVIIIISVYICGRFSWPVLHQNAFKLFLNTHVWHVEKKFYLLETQADCFGSLVVHNFFLLSFCFRSPKIDWVQFCILYTSYAHLDAPVSHTCSMALLVHSQKVPFCVRHTTHGNERNIKRFNLIIRNCCFRSISVRLMRQE